MSKRSTAAIAVVVGVAAGGIFLVAGRDDGPGAPDPAADRKVLAASIQASPGSFLRGYTRLVETLPNAKWPDGTSVNDSAVVGTVTSATARAGYDESGRPGTAGHAGARVTSFDDPLADWRTLNVTVDVEETLAGQKSSQLVFSWPLMGNSLNGEDQAAVERTLKGLGRIVVLSTARPAGPEYLGISREVPDRPYGIVAVAADGSLSLPLAGGDTAPQPQAATFLGSVDTLAELRDETAKPTWTHASR